MGVSIFHKGGNPNASQTISAIAMMQKINVNLKRQMIRGSSIKDGVSSTSLEVAPPAHVNGEHGVNILDPFNEVLLPVSNTRI